MKEMASGAAIGFIFTVIGYGIMLGFKTVAARYFGPEDFGMFTLSNTILGVLSTVAMFGLSGGISRFEPFYDEQGLHEKRTGYLLFVFSIPIVVSLILGVVTFIWSDWLAGLFAFPSLFGTLLEIIGFALPLQVFVKLAGSLLVAKKKILLDSLGYSIVEHGTLFAGVLLIIFFDLSVWHLVLLIAVSLLFHALFDVLVYVFGGVNLDLAPRTDFEVDEWVSFSLPLFFNGVFGFVISWADELVLGSLTSASTVGVYSIAFSIGSIVSIVEGSFASIFTPIVSKKLAQGDEQAISSLFRQSAAWIFGLSFPIFLIIAAFGGEVLSLFFGEGFQAGYIPLFIIGGGVLVQAWTGLSQNILSVYKDTNYVFWVRAGTATYNVVANFLLIPRYGMVGAAVASGSALAFENIAFYLKASHHVDLSFDLMYNVKFIAAGIPAALLAAFIMRSGLHVYAALPLAGVAYGLVYLLLLFALRTFTEADAALLREVEDQLGFKIPYIHRFLP